MSYFIENRISAYMLFLGLAIFGLISFTKLPVTLLPQTSYPGISIFIEYPGTSPEKIETVITKPVEKIIKTVQGIEKIDSISEEGKSRININFQLDTNVKIAALQVREKISLIRDSFPREVQEPVVLRYDPSDKPVIIATIEKKGTPLTELRDMVERSLKPRLQRIDGVSEINIVGGLQREIHIDIDRARFEARSLSFNDIFSVIQNGNVSLPAGLLHSGHREYSVYISSRYKNIPEIADTAILMASRGSLVKIYDFADVSSAFREKENIARLDGKERITVYIHKAGDANTLSVCTRAVKLLEQSDECKVKIIYNQGKYVSSAVHNVYSSCIWGACIVILVLYIFIRKPDTVLVIGLSIPLSIIIVFAFMYFLHADINIMSLSGLALGAGMIVDNGIVIASSVYSGPVINKETIASRVSFVKNAIIASTCATIGAFLPIVFGDTATRKMYQGLAITISAALIISLAIALILIPALFAALEGREKNKPHRKHSIRKHGVATIITAGRPGLEKHYATLKNYVASFFARADELETTLQQKYSEIIDFAFANGKKMLTLVGALLLAAAGMLALIKSEYIDPFSSPEFYAYCEYPTGTSLDIIDEAAIQAENHIKAMNISESISSKVEKWRGTITVKLKESISSKKERERLKQRIKRDLDKMLRSYGGFAYLTEADETSTRELDVAFIGNENDELRMLAKKAASEISSIQGIEDCVLRFREGRPEYHLCIDQDKASMLAITAFDVSQFFRNAVFGPVVTKFIDVDREIDVRMKYLQRQRATIDQIINYSVFGAGGALIPVKEIITLREETGPTKIWRRNGRRAVTITAKIGSLSYNEAVTRISTALNKIKFPEEYYYEFDETVKKIEDTRRSMMISVMRAVLIVYMILACLFESFVLPLIIMTTVPLAAVGVIIMLFFTLSSLNISVYIGLIVLAGIVVNNGILLVDAVNRGFRGGKFNVHTAGTYIKKVCMQRFRPVIMTASTTTLGLVPMLLKTGEGSNLWRPLSYTVMSGLIFSTALTLVLVPLLCNIVYTYYFKRGVK